MPKFPNLQGYRCLVQLKKLLHSQALKDRYQPKFEVCTLVKPAFANDWFLEVHLPSSRQAFVDIALAAKADLGEK